MKLTRYALALVICAFSLPILAQEEETEEKDYAKLYKRAEALETSMRYDKAIAIYEKILDAEPNNANVSYRLGFCYFNLPKGYEFALSYLENAAQHITPNYVSDYSNKEAPIESLYFLGKSYSSVFRYYDAIQVLDSLLKLLPPDEEKIRAEITQEIEENYINFKMMENPVQITMLNLGGGLRSYHVDHSPVVSIDESALYFTSKREGNTGGLIDKDGQFFEDIYVSQNAEGIWSQPQRMGEDINTPDNEASISLSLDGNTLLIYKSENGDGNIFLSRKTGSIWSEPEPLPEPINSPYKETHATLSLDGNVLYFTSNRPGGLGGLDIYRTLLQTDGTWSEPDNLGDNVNSQFDEEGPFIHPDGETMYYSSKGHLSYGGFDIFTSKMRWDSTWTVSTNLGFPINTDRHDVYFTPTLNGRRAYYSSVTLGSEYLVDIYKVDFLDVEDKEVFRLKGRLLDKQNQPQKGLIIWVYDAKTMNIVSYTGSNTLSGNYCFILNPDVLYHIYYQKDSCLFYSDEVFVPAGSKEVAQNRKLDIVPIAWGKTYKEIPIILDKGEIENPGKLNLDHVARDINNYQNLVCVIDKTKNPNNASKADKVNTYLYDAFNDPRQLIDIKELNTSTEVYVYLMDNEFFRRRFKTYPVAFESEKTLSATSYRELDSLVEFITPYPMFSVKMALFADDNANALQNIFLVKELNRRGIDSSRIIVERMSGSRQNKNLVGLKIVRQPAEEPIAIDVEATPTPISVNSVLFKSGSVSVAEYEENLKKIIDYLKEFPKTTVKLEGFSDSYGNDKSNKLLSEKRAMTVKQYFVDAGISPDRVKVIAYGEEKPIARNDMAEGRQLNRRVDITIQSGEKQLSVSELNVPAYLDMRYTVLVEKSKTKLDQKHFFEYPELNNITTTKTNSGYVYSIGKFEHQEEATEFFTKVQAMGFGKAQLVRIYELQQQSVLESNDYYQDTPPCFSMQPPYYTVQIKALRSPVATSYFSNIQCVVVSKGADGLYRYSVGAYSTREDAEKMQQEVVDKGYKDCFVKLVE